MDSKDNFSLGKPAEMEKNRRDSSNPEDASISTGQPAATSTPTNLIRKSARVVVLRRKTVESDLRNSSLVGRIPESWGHIKGRKNIRAPDTPERAPRTRNVSCSPRTPYTSKQPKTPRSANRLAGLVKEKYAQIKGRKQIQALSSPKTEPQSSLKTPKTPKGSRKTTTSKKHSKSSPKAPKMSPIPINLPTKNPAKMPVKSLTNTPKQSPIKSAMISPNNSPIQSTNYLPAKSATGSPKTPRKISSRKSSIESPKFSPIISPKTSPIPSPINTSIEPPKSLTELPTSSPKKSLSNSSINLPIMLPINQEMSPKADVPKAGFSEVGLLTAGAIIAPSDLRVGNKRSLASSEPTSVGNASTSESSPKRARLHVLQVSMGSPFSMTRSKKIKKVEVDQDDDVPVPIEISGNEGQDGLPEVLSEPEGSAPGSGMNPQMEPGLEPGVEPGLEPGMQPEIIDAITFPDANANTSMKCIVM